MCIRDRLEPDVVHWEELGHEELQVPPRQNVVEEAIGKVEVAVVEVAVKNCAFIESPFNKGCITVPIRSTLVATAKTERGRARASASIVKSFFIYLAVPQKLGTRVS